MNYDEWESKYYDSWLSDDEGYYTQERVCRECDKKEEIIDECSLYMKEILSCFQSKTNFDCWKLWETLEDFCVFLGVKREHSGFKERLKENEKA